MNNLESYSDGTDNKYCDYQSIITILEELCDCKLDEIKNGVNNAKVVVTNEQIKEYLDNKLAVENPRLKMRIEDPNYLKNLEFSNSAQTFVDSLAILRYNYQPYTLEYFKTYTDIVRRKALLLLNIIEKIGHNDTETIQDLITNLDINLDEKGNILSTDINRLVTPTVYNINTLLTKVNEANNLETYLTFKMSKNYIYKEDLDEAEMYPTESIQIPDLFCDYFEGNVPLSSNQKKELQENHNKSNKHLVKDFK